MGWVTWEDVAANRLSGKTQVGETGTIMCSRGSRCIRSGQQGTGEAPALHPYRKLSRKQEVSQ
jgi:hypothetical protein